MNLDINFIVPLTLTMLMLVTRSYTKSYSTTIMLGAVTISSYLQDYNRWTADMILYLSLAVLVFRSIVNHGTDQFIKR